ncbi:hypothetical protein pb186bvf_018188 [Paramecium bursaria]
MIFEIMRQIIRNKYSLFVYFNININKQYFFVLYYYQDFDLIQLPLPKLCFYTHSYALPHNIIKIIYIRFHPQFMIYQYRLYPTLIIELTNLILYQLNNNLKNLAPRLIFSYQIALNTDFHLKYICLLTIILTIPYYILFNQFACLALQHNIISNIEQSCYLVFIQRLILHNYQTIFQKF